MGGSQSRLEAESLEARRRRAIGMVSQGASQAEVARQLRVSREAVRQWVHAYRSGGPAALASRPRRKKGRVALADVDGALARASRESARPLTMRQVRDIIARASGVTYSASSVRAILRRLGYAYTREDGWSRPEGPPGSQDAKLRAG
jgi:transposase